jgi:hypothetical protein
MSTMLIAPESAPARVGTFERVITQDVVPVTTTETVQAAEGGGETFYRAMSESEYASLLKNNGLSVRPKGASQLFVTQDSRYLSGLASRPAQAGKYPTVVEFNMASGTRQSLINLGATHPSAAGLFPDLPAFSSGMDAVQLKLEAGGVPSYGLGSSPAGLGTFNSSILSFKIITP